MFLIRWTLLWKTILKQKIQACQKAVWRPESLINCSLALTLIRLSDLAPSPPAGEFIRLGWKWDHFCIRPRKNLGVWSFGVQRRISAAAWLCRGRGPRTALAAVCDTVGMALLCPAGLPCLEDVGRCTCWLHVEQSGTWQFIRVCPKLCYNLLNCCLQKWVFINRLYFLTNLDKYFLFLFIEGLMLEDFFF